MHRPERGADVPHGLPEEEKVGKMMNADAPTTPKSEDPADMLALKAMWNNIDWKVAEEHVNRLQTRISKAQLECKHDKVKRLQYLLTHSFHAKALAVRQVSQRNRGKHTPGVDGTTWETKAQRMKAVLELNEGRYRAKPLRRIYIKKKSGKLRPLSIPTMYDRAMQALYSMALDPVQEATADPNSYGFRKGRSCQDAADALHLRLAAPRRHEWILEGDISGCFDNISHSWLMENIPMDKKVLGQFLKAGFVFKERLLRGEHRKVG